MAKSMKNTKEITTVNESKSGKALTSDLGTLNTMGDALSDEMNGLSVAFEQIKIPIGGMTFFEMPSDDPEKPKTVKEFSAIILYHHPMRAYYKEPYTGANNPPDCGSMDAMEGIGEPGGDCAHCVLNQFGSAENGAKACKERHRLYLLLEGEIFPMVLSLPTGSLKDFARYLMHCISKGYKGNTVVTRFSLVKATNKGGIVFTKVRFQMERRLTDGEIAKIEPMVTSMKAINRTLTVETVKETEDGVMIEKIAG